MSKDTIYRQDAIDAVEESRRLNHHQDGKEACAHEYEHRHFLKILMELQSAELDWIPVSDRLPEENYWLGGSGKQFSDEVLVNIVNYDDEDMWVYISQTIDGRWALELPRHCEITAWRKLPEPYKAGEQDE